MSKKTIFLIVAVLSCLSCSLFADATETIVTRPWGGEKELKGYGVKKFSSTTAPNIALVPGKTYRFKCNITKTPPMHKQGYNHRMVLFGMKNKKSVTLLRIGTEVPADDEPHAINLVYTVPADVSAPFSVTLYNAFSTGTILVEDFVITEVKK